MEDWGRTFRKLRESKNYSLAQVSGDYKNSQNYVTSRQQVSRFELGISDITVTKLAGILENLGISFEEYLYHVRDFSLPAQQFLMDELGRLQELNNLEEIEKIYLQLLETFKSQNSKNTFWMALTYKAFLALKKYKDYKIMPEEIAEIDDYLFSTLEWNEQEVFVFGEFLPFLSESQVFEFIKELVHRTEFYRKLPQNKQTVILTLRDCTRYFINHELKEEARFGLQTYQQLLVSPVVDVYNRKEFLHIKAEYELMVGHKAKAKQIFLDLAKMYELLGYEDLGRSIQEKYEKL